jgi:hypothetical protein
MYTANKQCSKEVKLYVFMYIGWTDLCGRGSQNEGRGRFDLLQLRCKLSVKLFQGVLEVKIRSISKCASKSEPIYA